MVRKDTEGGKRLIKIGVSAQKFSSQNLSANHFDTISTPTSCELIEAIGANSGDYERQFWIREGMGLYNLEGLGA